MVRKHTGFDTYFNYSLVIKSLTGRRLTVNQIKEKTNLPISTIYKIIKDCQNRNVIIHTEYTYNGLMKIKVFTLKPVGDY